MDILTLNGTLEARDQVVVKSEVAGRIMEIRVKEGDRVEKGQPILSVDPEQLNNRRKRNELKARRSLIQLQQAKRNLANAMQLEMVGGTTKQMLTDLRWQVDLAEIQLKEDRLELDETKFLIGKSTVLAPASGTLISLSAKEGEVIMDGAASLGGGTPLGVIADLGDMTVTIKVSELDWQSIRPGLPATITTEALPGRAFPGRVEYVSKMASAQEGKNVRQFEAKVALDSASPGEAGKGASLAPGINVAVRFKILELRSVLAVPYDFVYRDSLSEDFKQYVWVREGSGLKRRAILTGASNYQMVQVLSGLEEGQSVQMAPLGTESLRGEEAEGS